MEFIGFLFKIAALFLGCMFLAFLDSRRRVAPNGLTLSVMSIFGRLGWKKEDEKGPRGIVFRQNLLIRFIVSLGATIIFTLVWELLTVSSDPKNPEYVSPFEGFWPFMFNVGIVVLATYTHYIWPKVQKKAEEVGTKLKEEAERHFAETDNVGGGVRGNGAREEKKEPIITPPPSGPVKPDTDPRDDISKYTQR